MSFVGFENFLFVLQDDWFHKSLYNTFWLALVSGVPQHLVAIPLAYFLHTAFARWRNAVTGLYFLPFITSSVAIALVFSSLFSRDFGIVNLILTVFGQWSIAGFHPLAWLFPDAEHRLGSARLYEVDDFLCRVLALCRLEHCALPVSAADHP